MKPKFTAVDIGDTRISTAQWGDGNPRIVMLHDGLGSIDQWRSVPSSIATDVGCSVLAYDRVGHGSSIPAPTSARRPDWLQSEAVALRRLLERVGIEHPLLVGHSDGATIALLYGAGNASVEAVIALAAHSWVERAAVERIIGMVADPDPVIEGLRRHHDNPQALFDSWAGAWTSEPFQGWDVRPLLHTLQAPTLVAQGADDEFATHEQVFATAAAVGPNARALLIPGEPHLIHHQHPQVFVDLVVDFVRGLDKPSG